MPHYRVNILNEHGDLLGAVELDCASDDAAKENIEHVLDGNGGELWRRVAVFQPNRSFVRPSHQGLLRRACTRIRDYKLRTKSH